MTEEDKIGLPIYWHLDQHVNAIIQMIRADELQLALKMCDMIPAWWRERYPKDLKDIKKTLYKQMYDQIEYATDDDEASCEREFGEAQFDNGYMFPRAEIIKQRLQELNAEHKHPWIFDLGCSHGNLPLGLIKHGFKFTYRGAAMNSRIQEKVKEWAYRHWQELPPRDEPTILWCSEVLEHAWDMEEVVHSAYKVGVEFDEIILSVPYGTLGGGLPDWSTRRLGHVRTIGAQEFVDFANKHWPGYAWTLYKAPSMVLAGQKI